MPLIGKRNITLIDETLPELCNNSSLFSSVGRELPFADNHQLYRFQEDHLGLESQPNPVEVQRAEEDWMDTLSFLTKICSDALMRLILKKP